MELWMTSLPEDLQRRCQKSISRLIAWMERHQADDGSWTPLWFGDQDAENELSPVYGTATAVEYLSHSLNPAARPLIAKGIEYLLSAQNEDGGWGGAKGVRSKVTLTSRALSALASVDNPAMEAIEKGFAYLYEMWQADLLCREEPIGLYFARLWYSEHMYNMVFTLIALKKLRQIIK
jgi:squalene-hopene/tetraprenyl-beta-curcumene cyclase